MLDHFTSHGAVDDKGLLTLGWHRPFRGLLQNYSGPASPYWASKGFIGLLLPPDHPVWTREESPLAIEQGDFSRPLAAPGWLLSGTASDGVVRVVNHGSDHTDPATPHSDDPCYARLAYSTHAAPDMPADPAGGPVDGTATLVDAEGRAAHRRPLERVSVEGRAGVSRSRAHWPADERWDPFGSPRTRYRTGPWITVASVLRGAVEIRLVRVDPVAGDEPSASWRLRLGGWALPVSTGTSTDGGGAPGDGALARDERPGIAVLGSNGIRSTVLALRGFSEARVHRATDSNPLGEGAGLNATGAASATPVLWTRGPVEYAMPYAAVVHLGGGDLEQGDLPRLSIRSEGPDTVADVTWPDGAMDSVRLPAPTGSGDRWKDDRPPEEPSLTTAQPEDRPA
jgi:hypothetical protein